MTLLFAVDLLGVFCFALSGCLLAVNKRFDFVGSLLLGGLAGLGGGLIRDVIIGADLPLAFDQPVYLAAPLLAALVVRAGIVVPGRFRRVLMTFDAAGLALFCVSGTLVALAAGLSEVGAVLMGVTTATGGGLLRDVVAREEPQVLRPDGGLYAVPAAVGAALVVLIRTLEGHGGTDVCWPELAVIVVVFGIRLLALRHRWQLLLAGPVPRDHRPDAPA